MTCSTGFRPAGVHFKLDRGIRQWDIIERLTSEFTSGAGARDGVKRTIFAVGDEKQSIFSFQGAAPREFDSRRREMETRYKDAQLHFESVAFKHSFRSGWTILKSVDYVFRDAAIYKSIHAVENDYPIHDALGDAAPALVDLWELEKPADKQDVKAGPLHSTPCPKPIPRCGLRKEYATRSGH